MDQPPNNQPQQSSTFIMPESSSQLAWLFNLDSNLTRAMGGLFLERDDDITGIHDILDLACGSGRWVLEIAHLYPHTQVTGVDINKSLIEYVRAHAKVQGIKNAHYQVMNILDPLPFPDASFDLINTRTLFSSLTPKDWPALLQECKRILHPGGTIRLTEMERHSTNSLAVEHIWDLFTRALYITGRSFSPDGHHIGINPHLSRLLREAGFQHIQNRAHTPEISHHVPYYASLRDQDFYAWKLLEPFLIKSGVATQEELLELQAQALKEYMAEDFYANLFYFTCWGEKPQ